MADGPDPPRRFDRIIAVVVPNAARTRLEVRSLREKPICRLLSHSKCLLSRLRLRLVVEHQADARGAEHGHVNRGQAKKGLQWFRHGRAPLGNST
jgi:hypothetical protein